MRIRSRTAAVCGAIAVLALVETDERREPQDVSISLPSGATVHVHLKPVPPIYRVSGTPRRLLDIYDTLQAAAVAGDATASTFLHRMLEQCRLAYGDELSLRRAIDTLRRDRVLVLAGGDQPARRLPEGAPVLQIESASLQRPYEFCRGVTDEQKRTSQRWLQAAINQGEFWSLEEAAVKQGNSREGVASWQALWKRGHFSALPALSIYFEKGAGGAPPDYVRSYAYNYLQLKLMQAAYGTGKSRITLPHVQAVEASVRRSAGFLTPAQQEAALQLAEQLLHESVDCCMGVG